MFAFGAKAKFAAERSANQTLNKHVRS